MLTFSALFCVLADVLSLLLRLAGLNIAGTVYRPVILVICTLLCSYGIYEALKVPPLKEITLSFADLPEDLHGKRIAVVADPQVGIFFRQERLTKALAKVMAARPIPNMLTSRPIYSSQVIPTAV